MYFPYLRGKQFELLALRELGSIMSNKSGKISPIIEPVKDSSTFKKAISDLKSKNINFSIIINPKVGDLVNSSSIILSILNTELQNYTNYQVALIQDGFSLEKNISAIKESKIKFGGLSIIHNATNDNVGDLLSKYEKVFPITNNVIDFSKTNRRYYRNFSSRTIVGLDDFFDMQQKNADYLRLGDSQFSEEYLFYKQDGFKGFSDFLTVGDSYSESGMLPFAVAIHLSYTDSAKKIRIKHFVSDSNDDRSDIAGKFAEALDKLVKWCRNNNQTSLAITQFEELHRTGHFPGLGSVKKLSIMHHIELVLKLI